MQTVNELKANVGFVLRGEVVALKEFVERMDQLMTETPAIQLVHKHVSASKLWINEGDGMYASTERESKE